MDTGVAADPVSLIRGTHTQGMKRFDDFIATLDGPQLLALFEHGDGVMTDLAASARLRPEQIDVLVRLMEESNPSWSPDVAYQLIASQDCTPGQIEWLIGWCDDPGTWDIACGKHPGGRRVYGAPLRASHRPGSHGRVRAGHRLDRMECAAGREPVAPPTRFHRRSRFDPHSEGPVKRGRMRGGD